MCFCPDNYGSTRYVWQYYRKKRDNESLMAPNRYFPRYVILGKPRYEMPCDGEKRFSIHQ